ncbi:hypothetical protein H8S33_11090 [Ornithinibacillus sp. BX22]|uniref:Uncharacterized protein n=2 Tax=Ornithinibacillus TaxID=484508 RepID=A0A923L6E4_9BACI|nr:MULTISPECIES: hypothetical protein [Ornithinibacillus]MBC5637350.1 hypothetical protein [Ornithinibacillus hominis]MBS3680343.1 hypothetical protein [Ornithinibacillus massiliensis]
MNYYYNPEVQLLLLNQSDSKVIVSYLPGIQFRLPLIAKRPPYFKHPRYEPYYTVI